MGPKRVGPPLKIVSTENGCEAWPNPLYWQHHPVPWMLISNRFSISTLDSSHETIFYHLFSGLSLVVDGVLHGLFNHAQDVFGR